MRSLILAVAAALLAAPAADGCWLCRRGHRHHPGAGGDLVVPMPLPVVPAWPVVPIVPPRPWPGPTPPPTPLPSPIIPPSTFRPVGPRIEAFVEVRPPVAVPARQSGGPP